jgi:hypothetical protein
MDTDDEVAVRDRAFAKAVEAILVQEPDMSFSEVVWKYRNIEVEFVADAPDDEIDVLETRRRIAERILSAAHSHDQSFEVCNEAWNNLVRLGFTNTYQESMMTWFYADCCLMNEKPEAGIAVLEPLIADFEGRLKQPNVKGASFYQQELTRLHKLLTELITLRDAHPPP